MRIGQLGHIVLNVRDIEASARFYREVLGLRQITLENVGYMFGGADNRTHHELLLIPAKQAGDDAPSRIGLNHIAWQVGASDAELKAAIDDLKAHGVAVDSVVDHGGLTHSAYFRDPDGNRLEVFVDVQPELWRTDTSVMEHASRGRALAL